MLGESIQHGKKEVPDIIHVINLLFWVNFEMLRIVFFRALLIWH